MPNTVDVQQMSFKDFVTILQEQKNDMHHVASKGPFHPTRDGKKLGDFHHEVSNGPHKDHVKFSGSHHMVHLHVHKDHKNKPGVKKLIDKFHKL